MRQLYVQIHLNNFLIILYEYYNSNLSPPNDVSSSHQMVDKRVGNWDGTSTFVQLEILQCSTIYDTSQQYKIRIDTCSFFESRASSLRIQIHICPLPDIAQLHFWTPQQIECLSCHSVLPTYNTQLHSYLQYILTAVCQLQDT